MSDFKPSGRLVNKIRRIIDKAAPIGPGRMHRKMGIGNVYHVPHGPVSECIGWMVVRYHPDAADLCLAVPVDYFPLGGSPDVAIPTGELGTEAFARCGESEWLPKHDLENCPFVAQVSTATLGVVRERLAALARGGSVPQTPVDCDPEYQEWMSILSTQRENLVESFEEDGWQSWET